MMMMIKIIVIIIIIILLFLFRALLDQVTVVEDNPSVRSTGLQPSASIKERSKVRWSENIISEIIFFSSPVDAPVFFIHVLYLCSQWGTYKHLDRICSNTDGFLFSKFLYSGYFKKILGFKVMQGATSGYLFNQVVTDVWLCGYIYCSE